MVRKAVRDRTPAISAYSAVTVARKPARAGWFPLARSGPNRHLSSAASIIKAANRAALVKKINPYGVSNPRKSPSSMHNDV
jgi:hypothetical protein